MYPIRLGVTFQRISCNKCSTNLRLSMPGRTGITVKFVQIGSTNVVRDSLIPSAPLERLTRSLHGFYRIYGRICRGIRPPRNSRSRVNWERRTEHLRRVAHCTVWVQGDGDTRRQLEKNMGGRCLMMSSSWRLTSGRRRHRQIQLDGSRTGRRLHIACHRMSKATTHFRRKSTEDMVGCCRWSLKGDSIRPSR